MISVSGLTDVSQAYICLYIVLMPKVMKSETRRGRENIKCGAREREKHKKEQRRETEWDVLEKSPRLQVRKIYTN